MAGFPIRIAVARSRKPADYLESVRRAGAEPVLLDRGADRPADVLDRVDAIVLTGGGDVDPALYGGLPDSRHSAAEPGRDAYEIELVVRALERDVPMLAICRGAQVLNVACGGTLVQHIPDEVTSSVCHEVTSPSDAIAHEVSVAEGSHLASLLVAGQPAGGRLQVNSRHHQAVRRLGNGLVTTATADDGVIEAIERPSAAFCIGVQWHPENFLRTRAFDALFAGLVAEARKAAAMHYRGGARSSR